MRRPTPVLLTAAWIVGALLVATTVRWAVANVYLSLTGDLISAATAIGITVLVAVPLIYWAISARRASRRAGS
jgi:hypothetical protein